MGLQSLDQFIESTGGMANGVKSRHKNISPQRHRGAEAQRTKKKILVFSVPLCLCDETTKNVSQKLVLLWKYRTQIKQHTPVFNPSDYRRFGCSKADSEFVRVQSLACNCQ